MFSWLLGIQSYLEILRQLTCEAVGRKGWQFYAYQNRPGVVQSQECITDEEVCIEHLPSHLYGRTARERWGGVDIWF